ncbi:monocarboxylate transporter 6 [Pagrus major]|uniref:monocarboxylate transporter 6 n=1 Tax=Pagrus major TaxID=143350 RepID=UPI003CC848EA
MTQVLEDQTPAMRNKDNALPGWVSAAQCFEEESAVHHPADATQAGGPAQSNQPAAPDRGWGWVVVAANMALSMVLAVLMGLSIFYTELQAEFHVRNTETSWVPAIISTIMHSAGLLCSMSQERFGCRATVMLGGLLSGLAMSIASLARTITHIYITGAITGLGLCLAHQASFTIIGHYFQQRLVFANALSSIGQAVGMSVAPLMSNALLGQFGWRGSFLIMGGILLNSCVCGALMRPVASGPNKPKHTQVTDRSDNLSQQQETKGPKDRVTTAIGGFIAYLRRHMAFDLLVSSAYYRVLTIGMTLLSLGYAVPFIFLVPYATHHNISMDRAALLMSIMGQVNIAMRPIAALILGLPCFSGGRVVVYVYAGSVVLGGLSNCICGASASFVALLLYVVIFSLSYSVLMTVVVSVLMTNVEMSRFPAAMALKSMMESVTILLGPPLAGFVVDYTGQYSYIFYASSLCVTSAGLYIGGSFYYLDTILKRDKEEERENTRTPSDLQQRPAEVA